MIYDVQAQINLEKQEEGERYDQLEQDALMEEVYANEPELLQKYKNERL